VGQSIAFNFLLPWLPPFPGRHGVGQNPDSFSPVRCPGVVSSQHTPLRIIPHRGQVPENASKPARSEHWRVFHEHEFWSNFANHSGHVPPKSASCAVDACAFPGGGNVLAREPSAHDVNPSAPRGCGKCGDVVPNWESWQDSVPLSLEQDASAIGFNFHSANCGVAEDNSAKDSASRPGEQMEFSHR
jgi:hypothetical protein